MDKWTHDGQWTARWCLNKAGCRLGDGCAGCQEGMEDRGGMAVLATWI